MRKKTRSCLTLLALVFSLAAVSKVSAQSLPLGLNLGYTTFMDGGPPAGPGLYYQQYFSWYSADTFRNANGDKTFFPDVDAIVSLNQFIWQSDQPLLLGGKWGLNAILPVVGIESDPPVSIPGGGSLGDSGGGLGDIWFGPFIQWDPIMGENGPLLIHRIELQTVFPTGRYDPEDALNPSGNVWQFNPYWAGTFWILPRWTTSWRIHYLWNSENTDPWLGLGAGIEDVQPGQAFHLNWATSYEILPKQLRAGINAYYLKQVTDARINGSGIPRSKEQILGIGPGVMYSFSQNDHLFLNLFFEAAAVNRPEGFKLIFRWTHHF